MDKCGIINIITQELRGIFMKALITGATSGIGMSFAKILSKKGWSLILTGRNKEMLCKLRDELDTEVEIFCADLANKEQVMDLYEFSRSKSVDLLINNAGFGLFGNFDETDLKTELELLNVNITALHILTKLFLRDFKKRNKGKIINVASVAAFMPGPLLSSYYASKSYVLRLSLAIAEELRHDKSNVTITVLCPGPVDTNFNNRAGVSFSVKPISPDYAAGYALKKAFSGKLLAIPNLAIQLAAFGSRFVPNKILSSIVYNVQKRKRADK